MIEEERRKKKRKEDGEEEGRENQHSVDRGETPV